MMKKTFRFYAITWAILLAVFNVICFATPSEMAGYVKIDGTFWVGYAAITLAMIGQLICASIAFKTENKEKLFLNIPLITESYTAMVVVMVVGAICMLIPNFPSWIAAVINILIIGFSAISVVKAAAAEEIVSEVEDKVKANTSYMRSLQAKGQLLVDQCQSDNVRALITKLAEDLRYSDSVSSGDLEDVEASLLALMERLQAAVMDGDDVAVIDLCKQFSMSLAQRNQMCKAAK